MNVNRSLAWLAGVVMAAAALTASHARSQGVEFAAAVPDSEQLTTLCLTHGAHCQCAGCRAYFEACGEPCPPAPLCPEAPDGVGEQSGAPTDALPEAAARGDGTTIGPTTSLSASLDTVAAATSSAPGMLGDFFGGGYNYLRGGPAQGLTNSVAGGDRLLKFSDNNSPLPQDRLFFNYHHFHNAVVDVVGREQDVDRFTFGLEKTFWDGFTSIEFRIPFTAALDASQTLGSTDTQSAEFGNLALALKVLALEHNAWRVGAGLGMIFPTADDSVIYDDFDNQNAVFANDSYYLQPFVGVYYRPNRRLFSQFVTQVNFDASGSVYSSFVSDFGFGSDRIYDQTLLFLDYSVGYWLYRSPYRSDFITGIAPMVELHYTSSLTPLDLPNIPGQPFEADFRRDVLNLTGGINFESGRDTSLRVISAAPLRDGTDRIFDVEFGMQLIRRY